MPKPMPVDGLPIEVARLAYSIQQAAIALSLSPSTLAKAISNGLIDHRRMGVLIRIPAVEVERIAREGLPVASPYRRKTAGPTTRGRPSPKGKAKPPKVKPLRKTPRDERRPSP